MIEYTYPIESLSAKNYVSEDLQKVVVTINGRVEAKDGSASASLRYSENVEFEPGQPFTPFQDLTETQVLGWISDRFSEPKYDTLRDKLQVIINAQLNPTENLNSMMPPWIN